MFLGKRHAQEQAGAFFTRETAPAMIDQLKSGLNAPYVQARMDTLGGPGREAIMLTVSLDPREEWINGILQNSRYAHMSIDTNGTVKHFSGRGIPNFRRRRVRSVDDLIAKLNAHFSAVPPAPG